MAEVTLGLVPDLTGTSALVELVGYARALEICVTGRRMDAAEAADRTGHPGRARAELDARRGTSPAILAGNRDAVVEIKALLAVPPAASLADQHRAEREAQVRRLRDLAGVGE